MLNHQVTCRARTIVDRHMPRGRDLPNPNRIETLDVFNPCVAACFVLLLAVILLVLAFTPGWYYVHYKDSAEGRLYCDLRLLECTLADCKQDVIYTSGYVGEGDCSGWFASMIFFILAALYSATYALYMAGILHGQIPNWKRFAQQGRYSECCVDTSVDLGEACPGDVCVDKGPCRGKLPHGSLGLGAPILMLLGLMNFLNQDLSHFDGSEAGFGWNFWLCVSTMVVCCCCISAIAFDASNDEAAIRAKLGARVAQRAMPPRPLPRPARIDGVAAGADAGGGSEDRDGPTEGERLSAALAGLSGKAKGFGAGVLSKARSSTPERTGRSADGGAPKRKPPALPSGRPATPPRP